MSAREALSLSQFRMQKAYNQNREDQRFEIGDQVLLATKNLSLKHIVLKKDGTRRKLAPKFIGPFEIVAMAESPDTYRINLPVCRS